MRIEQLVSAEPGWKAVFKEPEGPDSLSRIIGWAIVRNGDDSEIVGVIVDPSEPSRVVTVTEAVSPAGGSFSRYRYIAPEPTPAAAAPASAPTAAAPDDTPEQLAKRFIKRRL